MIILKSFWLNLTNASFWVWKALTKLLEKIQTLKSKNNLDLS